MTLGIAACSNDVTSHAIVRPTVSTAHQAMRLLQGQPTDPQLRFVYGYWPGGPAGCDAPHPKPTAVGDRYGVLICDAKEPLSTAYFVETWSGTSREPDEDTDRRLALIATNTLVPPVKKFSRP